MRWARAWKALAKYEDVMRRGALMAKWKVEDEEYYYRSKCAVLTMDLARRTELLRRARKALEDFALDHTREAEAEEVCAAPPAELSPSPAEGKTAKVCSKDECACSWSGVCPAEHEEGR